MSASSFRKLRVLLVVAALTNGCGERRDTTPLPAAPQRVVSLGPGATEIVVALGAMERLVGRSRWDTWPDTVRVIPEVGDAIRPSIERLVALRPDLVIVYPAIDNAPAIEALERAGIRVVALRIDSVKEFLVAVDTLGTLLGARQTADSIGSVIRGRLDSVRAAVQGDDRLRVFFPVWDQPLMTLGAGSYLSELVDAAGGVNVYADEAMPSLYVALEDVIRRDPDVVLTTPKGRERILANTRWRALRAVREGRVLAYDTLLVSQPSTRLGEAAASLAVLLSGARR